MKNLGTQFDEKFNSKTHFRFAAFSWAFGFKDYKKVQKLPQFLSYKELSVNFKNADFASNQAELYL